MPALPKDLICSHTGRAAVTRWEKPEGFCELGFAEEGLVLLPKRGSVCEHCGLGV